MYGIGLKRSIFKIGNDILFETDDSNNYSRMQMDVREWEKNESDWFIPFDTDKSQLSGIQKPYTRIRVTGLRDEIKEKFSIDPFINTISDKEVKEEITNISYSKPKKIVEVVKEHLGVSSNKEVGIKTFEYFVNAEDLNG